MSDDPKPVKKRGMKLTRPDNKNLREVDDDYVEEKKKDEANRTEIDDILERFEQPLVYRLPDGNFTARGARAKVQPATVRNIASVLKQLNIEYRFNMMRRQEEFIFPVEVPKQELLQIAILENLLHQAGIRDEKSISRNLRAAASSRPYHPGAEYMKALPPPEISSVPVKERLRLRKGTEFYKLIHEVFVFDNDYEKAAAIVYLYRTFIQIVECACGWELGREEQKSNVPLIIGPQGCGKTTFVRNLFPTSCENFVLTGASLHLDSFAARDSIHQVTSYLVTELGEIEVMFGHQTQGSTKNFISRTYDEYRLPYAKDKVSYPRLTTFIGTANMLDVLNDLTGARRYGPFVAKRIHNPRDVLDLDKLWAEFYHLWKSGETHQLNHTEQVEQKDREITFIQSDEIVDKLNEYFGVRLREVPQREWLPVTFTQLSEFCRFKPTPLNAHRVREWFQKHDIERRSRYRDATRNLNVQLCWVVPLPKDHAKHITGE